MDYQEIAKEFEGLSEEECYANGLTAKLAEKYGCTPKTVTNYRKRYLDSLPDDERQQGIKNAANKFGVDESSVLEVYFKDDDHTLRVRNPKHLPQAAADLTSIWKRMIDDVKSNVRVFKPIKYQPRTDSGLLAISPADVHIGKLASKFETLDEYNSSIACERVQEGVTSLIHKAKRIGVEKVLLLIGNDILHIDNPKRTTTSGTPQDTCGMWYDNFVLAKRLYYDIIMEMREIAPVHVQFNPSNHDFMSGFHLSQVVEAMFHGFNDVTFEVDMRHRKYYTYGANLIGSTHGDGAKIDDLPLLMANEASDWSTSRHRYIYIHHFHHKIAKDKTSVQIEAMRSVSGTDSWHHIKGYQHAPKAMEAFLHHPEYGQTDKIIHYF
jgi:hypothetical protein